LRDEPLEQYGQCGKGELLLLAEENTKYIEYDPRHGRVFDFECFNYSKRRQHSTLDYLSSVDFEKKAISFGRVQGAVCGDRNWTDSYLHAEDVQQ
jgi:hypothetical protein